MSQGLSLGDIMHVTNDLLTPDLDHNFVTAFFAILQPETRILRYGSAAQPAVLMHADGTVQRLDAQTPPLGVHVGGSEISDEITLDVGDVLVLYTDGLCRTSRCIQQPFRSESHARRAQMSSPSDGRRNC